MKKSRDLIKSIKENGMIDYKSILTDNIYYKDETDEFFEIISNNKLYVELDFCFVSYFCLTSFIF